MVREREIMKCQRCGADGDGDLRTLWHSCFYEMDELKLPFQREVLLNAEAKDLKPPKEPVVLKLQGGASIPVAPGTLTSTGELVPIQFYCLRTCKRCRSEWMMAIQNWFKNVEPEREVGSGIYVRQFGNAIEVTREEFERRRNG